MTKHSSLSPLRSLAMASAAMLATMGAAAMAEELVLEEVVPPSAFHGVHGLDFDADGNLLVGDIVGMTVYSVDITDGSITPLIGPPYGTADDVAVAPDGTIAWSNNQLNAIYALGADGIVREIARDLPGINAVGFHPDGRLFATQPYGANALFEVDMSGSNPPRMVLQPAGAMNGFDILDDGYLYAPQGTGGKVVRVDVDSGEAVVIAEGFDEPTGVKGDSHGNLYVNDLNTGAVYKLDRDGWNKSKIAQLDPGTDNLTVSSSDLIYVTNMVNSSIHEIDPQTGAERTLMRGDLVAPGGLAILKDGDEEWIYVADMYTTRRVNPNTGAVEMIERPLGKYQHTYPLSATSDGEHLVLSSSFLNWVIVVKPETFERVLTIRGLKMPHDALRFSDGSLLIAETGANRIAHYGADGKLIRIVAEGLNGPIGLAHKDAETVYVTESEYVSAITLDDGKRTIVADGLFKAEGIDLDAEGNIVVVDAETRSLLRIDPETGLKEVLMTDLPIGLKGSMAWPPSLVHNDVVVAEDGAFYIGSDIDTGLYRIRPKHADPGTPGAE